MLRQSPEDLLVTYAYGKPRFEGRTCTPIWCYTNTSSMIAGLAMEKATGSSFNSIVRSQIFAPLELDSTFAGGEQPFPPGLVESYGDINGDNQLDNVTKFDVEATNIIGGMGNIFSNAPDLMKFTQEVFGGEFLQPESKQQLLDFVALDPSNPEGVFGFGLGVENLPSPWGRSWGKGGTITGYVGQITYYPDRDVAAVALINGLTPQTETEGVQGTILSPSLNTYLTAEQDNNLESVPEPNGVVGLILLGSLGLWLKRKPLSISRLFK